MSTENDVPFDNSDFGSGCSLSRTSSISIRDSRRVMTLPTFNISPYYTNKVAEARAKVEKWRNASDSELLAQAAMERKFDIEDTYKFAGAVFERLEEAKSLIPSSKHHMDLNNLVIKELEDWIEYWIRTNYPDVELNLEALKIEIDKAVDSIEIDVDEYRSSKILDAERLLEYMILNLNKAVEDADPISRWIHKIREYLRQRRGRC